MKFLFGGKHFKLFNLAMELGYKILNCVANRTYVFRAADRATAPVRRKHHDGRYRALQGSETKFE